MPQIERVVPISAPADELSWERRAYPSPHGGWTLVLRDPREWHMSADGWRAELLSDGRDVSSQHKGALALAGRKGFRAPVGLRPWAPDGQTLALITWEEVNPVHLYDPEERSLRQVLTGYAFPHSAQWAPNLDRLLVPFGSGGQLYDASGKHQGTTEWTVARDQPFHTDWTRWGVFFLIARESPRSKARITFYDGATGRPVDALDLDPLDLVPYDAAKYAGISREGYTLAFGAGAWSAGFLLDTWHAVRFDPETDTLLLATDRPTSEPHRERGQLMCNVEPHWVAVILAA